MENTTIHSHHYDSLDPPLFSITSILQVIHFNDQFNDNAFSQ